VSLFHMGRRVHYTILIRGGIGSIVNALELELRSPLSRIQVEIIWKYITAREPVLMVMEGVLVVLWTQFII